MEEKKCVEDEKQNREIHRRKESKTDFNYSMGNCINFNDSVIKTRNQETIFEMEHRLRQEAKELAKKHVDVKPVKYLTK